jgi:hypothetical protein
MKFKKYKLFWKLGVALGYPAGRIMEPGNGKSEISKIVHLN